MTLLKPLCEQRGAKIAARTLYEGAAEFTPTGLPILTSNFAPKLCIDEKSDTGAESRIRVWKTEAIYTEKPTLLTHKISDADLQNRIEQGVMSPYMFFWLRQLYFLLNRDNHTRNIEPVPARIMEFTELCLRSGSDGRFQLWLQKVTGTLELAEASTASQVEKSAVAFIGEDHPESTQVASLLTSHGFRSGRKTSKRFYEKLFGEAVMFVVAPAVPERESYA